MSDLFLGRTADEWLEVKEERNRLFVRVGELEAENARLREALDKYRGQVDRYGNESASLALLGGGEK